MNHQCDICSRPATFHYQGNGWQLCFCEYHEPILNEPVGRGRKSQPVSDQELAGKTEAEQMKVMRAKGWSYNQIGKRLRYSRQRVYQMLKEEKQNQ